MLTVSLMKIMYRVMEPDKKIQIQWVVPSETFELRDIQLLVVAM
jgi:hypothetical protein